MYHRCRSNYGVANGHFLRLAKKNSLVNNINSDWKNNLMAKHPLVIGFLLGV